MVQTPRIIRQSLPVRQNTVCHGKVSQSSSLSQASTEEPLQPKRMAPMQTARPNTVDAEHRQLSKQFPRRRRLCKHKHFIQFKYVHAMLVHACMHACMVHTCHHLHFARKSLYKRQNHSNHSDILKSVRNLFQDRCMHAHVHAMFVLATVYTTPGNA